MPFMKNLKGKICQVLDPEVARLENEGWKILTDAEEAVYRETLALKQDLTSAVAIEEARVKAGLYDALNGVKKEVKAVKNESASIAKKIVSKVTSKARK